MDQDADKKSKFLPVSILVAALVVGGSIVYSAIVGGGGEDKLAKLSGAAGDESGGGADNNNPSIDDDVILGDPNAPVTLIEFGDYQCPYCKQMFVAAEVKIREEYIKTGKVRMVYRDFPLSQIHPFAQAAAEAAECARDQGKFWLYHDALFERQQAIPKLDFTALSGELDLDVEEFRVCYESKKYAAEVQKDYDDGIKAGVKGTPASFINGKFLEGAQPYEAFKAAIDEALQGAGK